MLSGGEPDVVRLSSGPPNKQEAPWAKEKSKKSGPSQQKRGNNRKSAAKKDEEGYIEKGDLVRDPKRGDLWGKSRDGHKTGKTGKARQREGERSPWGFFGRPLDRPKGTSSRSARDREGRGKMKERAMGQSQSPASGEG